MLSSSAPAALMCIVLHRKVMFGSGLGVGTINGKPITSKSHCEKPDTMGRALRSIARVGAASRWRSTDRPSQRD